jgi:hypothetical protein
MEYKYGIAVAVTVIVAHPIAIWRVNEERRISVSHDIEVQIGSTGCLVVDIHVRGTGNIAVRASVDANLHAPARRDGNGLRIGHEAFIEREAAEVGLGGSVLRRGRGSRRHRESQNGQGKSETHD